MDKFPFLCVVRFLGEEGQISRLTKVNTSIVPEEPNTNKIHHQIRHSRDDQIMPESRPLPEKLSGRPLTIEIIKLEYTTVSGTDKHIYLLLL